MATTHTPAGYTGSVDQTAEARRFAIAGGGRFRVARSTDWALAVSTTTNRTVTIATGQGVACGVLDETTSSDTVALTANGGSQDRLDAIVATFDWSARTVAFGVIQGTTLPPQVNTSATVVDLTKINRLSGLRYDALLGVVRVRPGVTILSSGDLADCRLWGNWNSLTAPSVSYLSLLDVGDGGRVQVGGTEYRLNADGTSTVVPRMYIQSTAPTGTIPDGTVWFQV